MLIIGKRANSKWKTMNCALMIISRLIMSAMMECGNHCNANNTDLVINHDVDRILKYRLKCGSFI